MSNSSTIIPFTGQAVDQPAIEKQEEKRIKIYQSTRHDLENFSGKTPRWFFVSLSTFYGCPRVVGKLDAESHQSKSWAVRSLRNYCSSTQAGKWRAASLEVDELSNDGEWALHKFHNIPSPYRSTPRWIGVSMEIKYPDKNEVVRMHGNLDFHHWHAVNAMFELIGAVLEGPCQFSMEFSKNER